jgi:hypothetical protein
VLWVGAVEVDEVIVDDWDERLEVVASVTDGVATGPTEPSQAAVLNLTPKFFAQVPISSMPSVSSGHHIISNS